MIRIKNFKESFRYLKLILWLILEDEYSNTMSYLESEVLKNTLTSPFLPINTIIIDSTKYLSK